MDSTGAKEKIFEFSDFRLIPGEGLLLRDGNQLNLNPKAFAVLTLLVERHGHLVQKSEIIEQVWEDAFVEEGAIAKSIWFIRQALGDASKDRYIQTVPTRGYRFVTPVTVLNESAATVPMPDLVSSGYRLPETTGKRLLNPEQRSPTFQPATPGNGSAPASASLDAVTTDHVDANEISESSCEEPEPIAFLRRRFRVTSRPLIACAGIVVAWLVGVGFYLMLSGKSIFSWSDVSRIAVLPIKPLNAETGDPAYDLGIADSLILKLGSSPKLLVKQLSAVRGYTGLKIDPLTVGREQNVDFVLSSHYQLANGRIKFTSQLFRVATGNVEDTYTDEYDTSDLFAAQRAIANGIGSKLLARFDSVRGEVPIKRGTESEVAYRFYIMAMNIGEERGVQNIRQALEYLDKAVAADPTYAIAWAAKAHIHRDIVGATDSDQHEHYRLSMEAIEKALSIDPNLSEAYSARCHNKNRYEYDANSAEVDCQRAVQLDPKSPVGHKVYANFLYSRGRFDEAIVEIKTAIDLQPVSYRNQQIYGLALHYARRYDEAEQQFKRLLELNPTHGHIHVRLVRILEEQGKESEAFDHLLAMLTLQKADSERIDRLKSVFARSGWRGVRSERIREEEANTDPSDYQLACLYAGIGDKAKALDHLENAYHERSFMIAVIGVDPQLDSLRSETRFLRLLGRVGK